MANGSPEINRTFRVVAERSLERASDMFAKFVRRNARIELKQVRIVHPNEATEAINAENRPIAAAYVDLLGDAPFKFLVCIGLEDARKVTDLIIGLPVGTTKVMDTMAMSAVQEVGNILASSVANVFSADFNISLKPEPPRVMMDFIGMIFAEFILMSDPDRENLILIESVVEIVEHNIDCTMFLLPVEGSDRVLSFVAD